MNKAKKKEIKALLKAAKKGQPATLEIDHIYTSPAERSARAAEKNANLRTIQIIVAVAAVLAVIGGVAWQIWGA